MLGVSNGVNPSANSGYTLVKKVQKNLYVGRTKPKLFNLKLTKKQRLNQELKSACPSPLPPREREMIGLFSM
jgi:hypothetical protein